MRWPAGSNSTTVAFGTSFTRPLAMKVSPGATTPTGASSTTPRGKAAGENTMRRSPSASRSRASSPSPTTCSVPASGCRRSAVPRSGTRSLPSVAVASGRATRGWPCSAAGRATCPAFAVITTSVPGVDACRGGSRVK
ncbi:hypothetical protein [Pseudoxanthomonas mexicana]